MSDFYWLVLAHHSLDRSLSEVEKAVNSHPEVTPVIKKYIFARTVEEKPEKNQGEDTANRGGFVLKDEPCMLWDAASNALSKTDGKTKTAIIIVTNHKDEGNTATLNEFYNELCEKSNVSFAVLSISGLPFELEGFEKIRITNSIDQTGTLIEEMINDLKTESPDEPCEELADFLPPVFSVPVFPIIKCDKMVVETVREALNYCIPYLEGLTGYLYYPTTTYLVDEYLFSEVIQTYDKPDSIIANREELQQFIEFVGMVCLNYHIRVPGSDIAFDYYSQWTSLNEGDRKKLHLFSEAVSFFFRKYLSNELKDYNYCIPALTNSEDPLQSMFDNIQEILNILTNINSRYPEFLIIERSEFFPIYEIWQKYLSEEEFAVFQEALQSDSQNYWKPQICYILPLFEIVVKLLRKLIGTNSQSSKYKNIIRTMRTYGVYKPRDFSKGKQVREIFEKNGYPSHVLQEDESMVLLCVDRIQKRVEEVLQNDNTVSRDLLTFNLVMSTLCHEHAHAIFYEGIEERKITSQWTEREMTSFKFSALQESLAEWAELNFFRSDEDMVEIITEQAKSGTFPEWKYAGMLFIENSKTKDKQARFLKILRTFRKDVNSAYNLLVPQKYRISVNSAQRLPPPSIQTNSTEKQLTVTIYQYDSWGQSQFYGYSAVWLKNGQITTSCVLDPHIGKQNCFSLSCDYSNDVTWMPHHTVSNVYLSDLRNWFSVMERNNINSRLESFAEESRKINNWMHAAEYMVSYYEDKQQVKYWKGSCGNIISQALPGGILSDLITSLKNAAQNLHPVNNGSRYLR